MSHSRQPNLPSQQILTGPVLVPAIGQVAPNSERDLLLVQLLDRNLQRIRLALQIHQHRRIHADLQRACAQHSSSFVFGHVRRSRALLVGDLLVQLGRWLGRVARLLVGIANRHNIVAVPAFFSFGFEVEIGLGRVVDNLVVLGFVDILLGNVGAKPVAPI